MDNHILNLKQETAHMNTGDKKDFGIFGKMLITLIMIIMMGLGTVILLYTIGMLVIGALGFGFIMADIIEYAVWPMCYFFGMMVMGGLLLVDMIKETFKEPKENFFYKCGMILKAAWSKTYTFEQLFEEHKL